ncbi:MAG: DUF4836 family protein [Bacteroidetes bacterium]|nr:DUF4836 family protein [Bacteroidota bacterium]
MKSFSLRLLSYFALVAILMSSCGQVPRQAHYIPKNALAVVGVHTGEIRKELAWSVITGSGLLEELRKNAKDEKIPEVLKDITNSGIDFSSSLYGFIRLDARFPGKMKQAIVLPLSDNSALNSFLQKHFPGIIIHKDATLNMALFPNGFCAGWNDEVLIVMNEMVHRVQRTETAQSDTIGGMAIPMPPITWEDEIPDSAGSLAELAATLRPAKGSGIADDKRFLALEKSGTDLSFWLSYDPLVDWYYSENEPGQSMLSASVAEMLMKGSAMATGVNFKKGRIEGLIRYFPSDSLKDVAKEFGKENVDADMLRRLPSDGLNMAGGIHLSPALIKLLLQRLNLSGVANLALISQGLTLDEVLGGFSGDMVFAINHFKLRTAADSLSGDDAQTMAFGSPKMDFVFAMKIGDKMKLGKLIGYAVKSNLLQELRHGVYGIPAAAEVRVVVGEKYLAISSNEAFAQAFLKEHAGAMPDAVHREISGHPSGIWLDLKGLMQQNSNTFSGGNSSLSAMQQTLESFSLQGGEMKEGANEYRFKLQMTDQKENSLLQLLQLLQRSGMEQKPVNSKPIL